MEKSFDLHASSYLNMKICNNNAAFPLLCINQLNSVPPSLNVTAAERINIIAIHNITIVILVLAPRKEKDFCVLRQRKSL